MCGIAGYINNNVFSEEDVLKEMMSKIHHRGPDATDCYYNPSAKVALGHNRLSIIDPSTSANQPMQIGDVILVFNGEIYNFLSLKDQYLSNEVFFTHSDTEVLLRLYIKLGIEETLRRVRGMFAFAIYDKNNDKMYLARDQVGKKPVYYFEDEEGFFFASEIRAFRPLGKDIFSINEDVFTNTMYYRASKELSPYRKISMLENGHYLAIDLQGLCIQKHEYFNFNDLIDEKSYLENSRLSEAEIHDKFEHLLTESIRRRLVADVEVASINSGGVDSSLISAIAYRLARLKMLHVDVEDYSERKYAELLSAHLNEDLLILKIRKEDFHNNIDSVIDTYEFPLVHPNSFGISEVARLAREHNIKVLLGGEGADELFGGYGYQRKYYISQVFSLFLPSIVKGYLKKVAFLLSDHVTQKAYQKDIYCTDKAIMANNFEKSLEMYTFIPNRVERNTQAYLLNDLNEYLQPLLLRADKMGMKHSVELRSPFLDLEIIEFALNLPLKYKLSMRKGKNIVKHVARKYLPKEITDRKKAGFAFPFIDKCLVDPHESAERNYVLYSKNILSR
jgi:asparagine synthase (glutamine-hydrolysing)